MKSVPLHESIFNFLALKNKAFLLYNGTALMKKRFFPTVLISLTVLSSCSLKYGMKVQDESNVPEFVFDGVDFNRYEDGKKTMALNAEKLEQYKNGNTTYAKEMEFKIYGDDNEVQSEGKCGYLSADTSNERYALYDNIEINNKKDDLNVKAGSLKWNGKSEQLTSGRNDKVIIQKGDTVLQGTGFSASGVSKRFSFTGNVSGEVNSKSKNEDNSERNIESEKIGEQKE